MSFNLRKSEESNITPGVGTDIFIRKKEPGAKVGKGYIVDIYENGIKVDTQEVKTKSEYTDIIREFKLKYNTDRAFQNELQVHITFKTKEERGEEPERKEKDTTPVNRVPEETSEEIGEKKKTEPLSLKEKEVPKEETMATIDNILLKQANTINNLLQGLINPDLPVKLRKSEMLETTPIAPPEQPQQEVGAINSVPDTAAPEGMEDKNQIKQQIIKEVVNKFTSFISEKINIARESGIPVTEIKKDEIYNPLKAWYGALAREIEQWNQMSNGIFTMQDINDISTETSKILKSKDPNLISQQLEFASDNSNTKQASQIDEETANLISEIASMGIATQEETDSGGELGGDPTKEMAPEEPMKVGSDQNSGRSANENVVEFTTQIHMQGPEAPIGIIAKDLDITDKSNLMAMFSILEKKSSLNESETAAATWIQEELDDKRDTESCTKDFWRYAENLKGTHNMEDAFLQWIDGKNFKLDNVKSYWNKISKDVHDTFYKIAVYLGTEQILNAFNFFIVALDSFLKTNPNIADPRDALDDTSVQPTIEQSLLDYLSANISDHITKALERNANSNEVINEVISLLHSQRNDHIRVIVETISNHLLTLGNNRNIVRLVMTEFTKYLDAHWDSILNSGKIESIAQSMISQQTNVEPIQQDVAIQQSV